MMWTSILLHVVGRYQRTDHFMCAQYGAESPRGGIIPIWDIEPGLKRPDL
jgi:hypothetical protein